MLIQRLLPLSLVFTAIALAGGGKAPVSVPEPSPVLTILIGGVLLAAAKFRPFSKKK